MIELEKIFSDGMVLQRRQPITVFGKCGNTEIIKVSIENDSVSAQIKNGQFKAVLPAREAACGLTMTLTAENDRGDITETVTLRDIAVGEVWIAAGQSNMEYPVKYTVEEKELKALGADKLLRFFDVPKISYDGQENDRSYDDVGFWDSFSPDSIDNFSAVALIFALKLKKELQVPVGIIGCNWGATSASSWISEEYLRQYPKLDYYFESYNEAVKDLDIEWYQQTFLEKQQWGLTPEVAELNDKLNKGELDIPAVMKKFTELPQRIKEYFMLQIGPMDQRRPCILYETMVKRIMGYGAKGVIWYQGEADEVLPKSYALLFSQLVKCWRDGWGQQLAFLTVQLAPFKEWLGNTGKAFPELRRQQDRAAALIDGVWLASIMDAGMETDIHPKTKRAAGERLALLALGKVYGRPVLCEAPSPADTVWEENKITVYMAHSGSGLYCESHGKPDGLVLTADGEALDFETEIGGCTLTLHTPPLSEFAHVQLDYARSPYVKADIYNSAGLCAKPFVQVRPKDWK